MAGGLGGGGGVAGGGGQAGGASGGSSACTCQPPANATASCTDGGCDFVCAPGFHRCGTRCVADDSIFECGAACAMCPDNGGSARCVQNVCDFTCAPTQARCQGQCVTASDAQCGASCVSCAAPAQCRAGACVEDCGPGLIRVAGTCREGRDLQLGLLHGCARHDGGVVCWGTGVSTGALGSGMDAGRQPQPVTDLSGVVSLSVGDNFGCGLLEAGGVRCWGDNMFGQLGNGGSNNAYTPQVALASGAVSLAAGARHACALLGDARVVCWGSNLLGQHGTGTTALSVRAPQPMALDAGVTALFAGSDGTWTLHGESPPRLSGDSSQFGPTLRPTPVALFDGGVRFIAATTAHSCAIRSNRTLECWGRGLEGQLGYAVGGTTPQPVRPVPGLGQVFDVCVGQSFTCAVIGDGGVRCFGAGGQGQLGGGNVNPSTSPVEVLSLPAATQVACRFQTACAMTSSGVFCWGDNTFGQLGVPTPMSSAFPIAVPFP